MWRLVHTSHQKHTPVRGGHVYQPDPCKDLSMIWAQSTLLWKGWKMLLCHCLPGARMQWSTSYMYKVTLSLRGINAWGVHGVRKRETSTPMRQKKNMKKGKGNKMKLLLGPELYSTPYSKVHLLNEGRAAPLDTLEMRRGRSSSLSI